MQDIGELDKDQLVCAATSKQFMLPKEGQQEIEIKANWGRARKQYGPNATDIVVTTRQNNTIGVSFLLVTINRKRRISI